jgi:transcriptional regulator with XRE-family HTH domain
VRAIYWQILPITGNAVNVFDNYFRRPLIPLVQNQIKRGRRVLPEREKAIGQRLRAIREHLNLSQTQAATQLGVTRERLASYEDGRAPVRFDFALKFCRQFIVSEEWLALGENRIIARWMKRWNKPKRSFDWHSCDRRKCMSLLLEPAFHDPKPGTLFSEAYDAFFDTVYQKLANDYEFPRLAYLREGECCLLRNWFHALMDIWLDRVDEAGSFRLLTSLSKAARDMICSINMGHLTEQERDVLIDEATTSGALKDQDLMDWRKTHKFVMDHTEDYLQRYRRFFSAEKAVKK